MKTMYVSDVRSDGKQTVVFKLVHSGDRLAAISAFNKMFAGTHWMTFTKHFAKGKGVRRT